MTHIAKAKAAHLHRDFGQAETRLQDRPRMAAKLRF